MGTARPSRLPVVIALLAFLVAGACSSGASDEAAVSGPSSPRHRQSVTGDRGGGGTVVAHDGQGQGLSDDSSAPARSSVTSVKRNGGGALAPQPGAVGGPAATEKLPPNSCPNPKTCRYYFNDYAMKGNHWPFDDRGRAVIPYWLQNDINVSGVSDETFAAAVRASMATWVEAAPSLFFVFEGWTAAPPVPNDGVNTIGFAQGCGGGCAWPVGSGPPRYEMIEADIMLGPGHVWSWTPCGGADGSCTPANKLSDNGVAMTNDLQAFLTHELGHWLTLADISSDDYVNQTMSTSTGENWTNRQKVTLALGDVLGVRELYPCACPVPPIYSP